MAETPLAASRLHLQSTRSPLTQTPTPSTICTTCPSGDKHSQESTPAFAQTGSCPAQLSPIPTSSHHFQFQTHIHQYPQTIQRHPCASDAHQLLRTIPMQHTGMTTTQGVTWLELLVLYRMQGYGLPIPTLIGTPSPRASLRQQLHQFRLTVRKRSSPKP